LKLPALEQDAPRPRVHVRGATRRHMIVQSRHGKGEEQKMDLYELTHALNWTYGVRLTLNAEKTRAGLTREDAARVPPEIKRAIREHHDELLRTELFKDAHMRLQRWMTGKHGAAPDGPLVAAARRALGEDEAIYERLNEAWFTDDLDEFKEALAAYMRPAAVAFKKALAGEERELLAEVGTREDEQDPLAARRARSPRSSRRPRGTRRSAASGKSRGTDEPARKPTVS
jgi:hypothetical protein